MAPKAPLTHFLALPLYTTSSAHQLNAALSRFTQPSLATTSGATTSVESDQKAQSLTTTGPNTSTLPSADRASTTPGTASTGTAISSNGQGYGIPEDAIRPASTLHLTLGVMSLRTKERIDAAVDFLKELDLEGIFAAVNNENSTILDQDMEPTPTNAATPQSHSASERSVNTQPRDPRANEPSSTATPGSQGGVPLSSPFSTPLRLTLRGLHAMQHPKATTVVYAAPHDQSGRLLPVCQKLRAAFVEAGFVVPDERGLKLHATMVNTVYSKGGDKGIDPAVSSKTNLGDEQDNSVSQDKAEKATDGGTATTELQNLDDVDEASGSHAPEVSTGVYKGKTPSPGKGKRKPKPQLKIDARELIQKWQNEEWAEITVEKVVICKMGAKEDSDGLLKYLEIAEARLT